MNPILIAISPGELIDRISILQLKVQHARDSRQRTAIQRELDELLERRAKCFPGSPELSDLIGELAAVNRRLWDAEDELRLCEKRGEFGRSFVRLARSVCQNNDRRCELRRQINGMLGTAPGEVKIYSGSRRCDADA